MTRDEERLALVTDFGSLRQGDLVVVKPCGWCGRAHRGQIFNGSRLLPRSRTADGEYHSTVGCLELVPAMSCDKGGGPTAITPRVVAEGRLYRVDTGLTRDADTHEAAPAKKPRELAKVAR